MCDQQQQQTHKYLLAGDVLFSLKFGPSPFEWSLFIDTELNTGEPDLSLKTQRTEWNKH